MKYLDHDSGLWQVSENIHLDLLLAIERGEEIDLAQYGTLLTRNLIRLQSTRCIGPR
jgi:hypothetical protein